MNSVSFIDIVPALAPLIATPTIAPAHVFLSVLFFGVSLYGGGI